MNESSGAHHELVADGGTAPDSGNDLADYVDLEELRPEYRHDQCGFETDDWDQAVEESEYGHGFCPSCGQGLIYRHQAKVDDPDFGKSVFGGYRRTVRL